MKKINIPGLGSLEIENLVLDYNGTIAVDGELIPGVREKLGQLSDSLKIYILTADTFDTVESECEDLEVEIKKFNSDEVSFYKKKIVESLGEDNSICIGNGYNDIEMFKVAGISICTIQEEGASGKLFLYTDVVVTSILDALDMLIEQKKVKATLRG